VRNSVSLQFLFMNGADRMAANHYKNTIHAPSMRSINLDRRQISAINADYELIYVDLYNIEHFNVIWNL